MRKKLVLLQAEDEGAIAAAFRTTDEQGVSCNRALVFRLQED